MKKVLVIGCPGAGKSTFARSLHELTGLPLVYLDRLWHRADRTTVSQEEFDDALEKAMAAEEWIIDGNYSRTMEIRLKHCDTVFFLDYPLEVCLEGVRSRIGTVREDMPWVEEEFDPEFRQYILDFSKDRLPQVYQLMEQYKAEKQIFIFHSREEASMWLAERSYYDQSGIV